MDMNVFGVSMETEVLLKELSIFFGIIITAQFTRGLFTSWVMRVAAWAYKKKYRESLSIDYYRKLKSPLKYMFIFIGIKLSTIIPELPFLKGDFLTGITDTFFIISISQFIYAVITIYISSKIQENYRTGRHVDEYLVAFVMKVIKVIVLVITFFIVGVKWGMNVSGVVTSLGVGGLAFALAAKDTLSNFFAGVMLIFDAPFKVGDWVDIGEGKYEGSIVEMGLRSTSIRTFDNAVFYVPNSVMALSPIKNYSNRVVGRRIKLLLKVPYSTPISSLQKLKEDILEMLKKRSDLSTQQYVEEHLSSESNLEKRLDMIKNKEGIKDTLAVNLVNLGEAAYELRLYAFTKTVSGEEFWGIQESVLYSVMDIFKQNNIEMAYPTQKVIVEMEK